MQGRGGRTIAGPAGRPAAPSGNILGVLRAAPRPASPLPCPSQERRERRGAQRRWQSPQGHPWASLGWAVYRGSGGCWCSRAKGSRTHRRGEVNLHEASSPASLGFNYFKTFRHHQGKKRNTVKGIRDCIPPSRAPQRVRLPGAAPIPPPPPAF